MPVRIVIHNEGDRIYTMSPNGQVRAFLVNNNGVIEASDMASSLKKEEQVDLSGADD
jgi:hypothetical protein